jgi:hypothetical protein
MSRLPNPGGDDGVWASVLNDYVSVEHAADGTHKNALKKNGDIVTGDLQFPSTGFLLSDGTTTWRLAISTTGHLTATRTSDNLIVDYFNGSSIITQGLG